MMQKFLIFLVSIIFAYSASQQKIKIDQYAVISDSLQLKKLKNKYKLIGLFQKIGPKAELKYARVLRETDQEVYRWGYIDLYGKEVFPAKYISLSEFDLGLVVAKENIINEGEVNQLVNFTKKIILWNDQVI